MNHRHLLALLLVSLSPMTDASPKSSIDDLAVDAPQAAAERVLALDDDLALASPRRADGSWAVAIGSTVVPKSADDDKAVALKSSGAKSTESKPSEARSTEEKSDEARAYSRPLESHSKEPAEAEHEQRDEELHERFKHAEGPYGQPVNPVAAVPLPAAAWLLVMGFLGLIGSRLGLGRDKAVKSVSARPAGPGADTALRTA